VAYSYRAYGFGIHSTINIPGLLPADIPLGDYSLHLEGGSEPEWAQLALRAQGRVISHLPAGQRTADPSFILTEHGHGSCYELSYSDGTRFVVNGAAPPQNSALASAGAELHVTAAWSLAARFDGEFASGSQTYAGTGTLRCTW